jgi:hypothetical protein
VKAHVIISDVICQDHDEVGFVDRFQRWDGLVAILLLLLLLYLAMCSCKRAARARPQGCWHSS